MSEAPPLRNKMTKLASVRALAIQKGMLTHDVDKGSKCLKCGPACEGFSLHFWRKICENCLCPREEHDINPAAHEEKKSAEVGKIRFHPDVDQLKKQDLVAIGSPGKQRAAPPKDDEALQNDNSSSILGNDDYTWIPRDSSVNTAKAFFKGLPENKKPMKGTPGARYWQRQKIRQLPRHDSDYFFCNELTDEEHKQMELFVQIRNDKCQGKGKIEQKTAEMTTEWVCNKCNIPFEVGEAAVMADKLPSLYFHPGCFCCSECNELLIELIYFVFEDRIFCGRHHAEKLKPRCGACDEIIFCHEYTRAEDQSWHIDHFSCLKCDEQLAGCHYMMKNDQPHCLNCYEKFYASNCQKCGKTISIDQKYLSHNGLFWHANPECFKCSMCKKDLLEKPFLPKSGKLFCSKTCYKNSK